MKLFNLIALTVLFTSTASAQFFTGPAAAGTGGAGRAAIEGSESAIINPATLAYMDRYHMSLVGAEGSHPAEGYQQTYGLVLTDGSTDKIFPGAISYLRQRVVDGGVEAERQDIHLAIGKRLSKFVGFGFAGHYRTWEHKTASDYYQTNMDFGLMITPLENIGIAFVVYNALSADEQIPLGIRDIPSFALGFNYIYAESFSGRIDLVRPDKYNTNDRTDVHAGLQSIFMETIAARLGMMWKETVDQTWLTAGFGYLGPRLSLNYAYQQDTRDSQGSRHVIDLWMGF